VVRRSFRLGLRFGVLVGMIVALVKVLQSRREQPATDSAPWSRETSSWAPPPPPAEWVERSAAPAVTPPPAPVAPAVIADLDPGLSEEIAEMAPPPPPAAPEPPVVTPAVAPEAPAASPEAPPPAGDATAASSPPPAAPVKKARKAAKVSKVAKATAWPAEAWIEPAGSTCPNSHPVKAKLSSRIFHLPGMFAYERTRPDRCYSDAASAEADGFIRAKR